MNYIKFVAFISLFVLIGVGCTQIGTVDEAYQCEQDSDCTLSSQEYCTTVCPSCRTKDATSDEMEAINIEWCVQAKDDARTQMQEQGEGIACAACIAQIENSDQIEIRCVKNTCTKSLK